MKGTYVERDRKKEKKKPKGTDAAGAKKGVPGAAAPMVAGVPAAMPVSGEGRRGGFMSNLFGETNVSNLNQMICGSFS